MQPRRIIKTPPIPVPFPDFARFCPVFVCDLTEGDITVAVFRVMKPAPSLVVWVRFMVPSVRQDVVTRWFLSPCEALLVIPLSVFMVVVRRLPEPFGPVPLDVRL